MLTPSLTPGSCSSSSVSSSLEREGVAGISLLLLSSSSKNCIRSRLAFSILSFALTSRTMCCPFEGDVSMLDISSRSLISDSSSLFGSSRVALSCSSAIVSGLSSGSAGQGLTSLSTSSSFSLVVSNSAFLLSVEDSSWNEMLLIFSFLSSRTFSSSFFIKFFNSKLFDSSASRFWSEISLFRIKSLELFLDSFSLTSFVPSSKQGSWMFSLYSYDLLPSLDMSLFGSSSSFVLAVSDNSLLGDILDSTIFSFCGDVCDSLLSNSKIIWLLESLVSAMFWMSLFSNWTIEVWLPTVSKVGWSIDPFSWSMDGSDFSPLVSEKARTKALCRAFLSVILAAGTPPCSWRYLAQPRLDLCMAASKGVRSWPLEFLIIEFTNAPWSIRTLHISILSYSAAICRSVRPSSLVKFTDSGFAFSSQEIKSFRPEWIASWMG